MTSPLFGDSYDWMDDTPEEGGVVGVYPAIPIEPDMTRYKRIAEARKAGLRLWEAVQKELVKRA